MYSSISGCIPRTKLLREGCALACGDDVVVWLMSWYDVVRPSQGGERKGKERTFPDFALWAIFAAVCERDERGGELLED